MLRLQRQLFVDLDGPLADFDAAYSAVFGERPDRTKPEPFDMWGRIRAHGDFFGSMPVAKNAYRLWFGLCKLHPNPVILTGCPKEMPEAAEQKRQWVRRHFGWVNVITCQSKDKRLVAKPGDVLVDDWLKYCQLWEEAGGVFVHHPYNDDYTMDTTLRVVGGLLA